MEHVWQLLAVLHPATGMYGQLAASAVNAHMTVAELQPCEALAQGLRWCIICEELEST